MKWLVLNNDVMLNTSHICNIVEKLIAANDIRKLYLRTVVYPLCTRWCRTQKQLRLP